MAALADILLCAENRPRLIADCVQLVASEVKSKSGIAGLAVKGAYAVVTKLKPGIIREAVERLIDEFVGELEASYAEFVAGGRGGFEAFVSERRAAVANSLLGVTDRRIENADRKAIKKAYAKLRPTGEKHVQAAVPGVGRVVAKYL